MGILNWVPRLLSGMVVLAVSGCGSCGGCGGGEAGRSIFKSLMDVSEAVSMLDGGDLEADPYEGDQLEDSETGTARKRRLGRLAGLRQRAMGLETLDSAKLKKRFAKAGWKCHGCEESTISEEDVFLRGCRFSNKQRVALVTLIRFDRTRNVDEFAHEAYRSGSSLLLDGKFALQIVAYDVSQAKKMVAKFPYKTKLGADRLRAYWEKAGFFVKGCFVEDIEDSWTASCEMETGSLTGSFVMLADPEGYSVDPDDEQDYFDDPGVTVLKGDYAVTLELVDQDLSAWLLAELFSELTAERDRMLVSVEFDDYKPDERDWDAGNGAPDPFVTVDGKSYRSQRCKDEFFCYFSLPLSKNPRIQVFDADLAADDSAGAVNCAPGSVCPTGSGALVRVRKRW